VSTKKMRVTIASAADAPEGPRLIARPLAVEPRDAERASDDPPASAFGSLGRAQRQVELAPLTRALLERIAAAMEEIGSLSRAVCERIVPGAGEVVGTPYVARKLGCTTVWVAEMVRRDEIPRNCVVPGTGNGKPWKFYRHRVEAWLSQR
jgi:hypothetical protein